jgi:hypothetical protein
MKLYSYVVARDYGFAPNPFFGICTLATCKPQIRKTAAVGDWIVGTGSRTYSRDGHLVFVFMVSDILSYNDYWDDPRFQSKKPYLAGSLKQAFGDNIYHSNADGTRWYQVNSHHSLHDGEPNPLNVNHDTRPPRVLIGDEYIYWGGSGPKIPARFRNYRGEDICKSGPGHKCSFSTPFVTAFLAWIHASGERGYISQPAEFAKIKKTLL